MQNTIIFWTWKGSK